MARYYVHLVRLIHTDSKLTFETLLQNYFSNTTVLGLVWLDMFSSHSTYELEAPASNKCFF